MSEWGTALPSWATPDTSLPDLLAGMEAWRRGGLASMPPAEIAPALGAAGRRFTQEGDPYRAAALAALVEEPGYSAEMATLVLDGIAREWSPGRLQALVHSEFGTDAFVPEDVAPGGRVSWTAMSPSVHLCAGNVPGVSVTSLIRGLLVGAAVLIKPGRADRALPVLFHRALEEEAPDIAAAAAVYHWDREDPGVAETLKDAALLVVYGGANAIRWARARAGANTRLVEYPHRVSALLVTRDGLGSTCGEGARFAAKAVAVFEQRGCVSPHGVLVVKGGDTTPEMWAERLAEELALLELALPPGRKTAAEASAFHQEAGTAEMEEAAGTGTRVWGSGTTWRVVFDPHGTFRPSCLGRFVRVYPAENTTDAAERLSGLSPFLQTVGIVGRLDEAGTSSLLEAGALRVVDAEHVPWPPIWARLDGTEPLRSLVRWVYSG